MGYQKAAIQEMGRLMLPVVGMKPQSDKRSRLQVVEQYIKNGTVLFSRSRMRTIVRALFQSRHSKRTTTFADGPVWLIWGLVDQGLELPKIHWIDA